MKKKSSTTQNHMDTNEEIKTLKAQITRLEKDLGKRKRLRGSTYEIKSKRLVSFGLLISLFSHVWKQFPIFL